MPSQQINRDNHQEPEVTGKQMQAWIDGLVSERNNLQADIINRKKMRINFLMDNAASSEGYIVKLGELSLAFAALVVPIILVTDSFENIRRPGYLFAGTTVYLVVGLFSMIKRKRRLELDANNLPGAGLDIEMYATRIHNLLNKLIRFATNKMPSIKPPSEISSE